MGSSPLVGSRLGEGFVGGSEDREGAIMAQGVGQIVALSMLGKLRQPQVSGRLQQVPQRFHWQSEDITSSLHSPAGTQTTWNAGQSSQLQTRSLSSC